MGTARSSARWSRPTEAGLAAGEIRAEKRRVLVGTGSPRGGARRRSPPPGRTADAGSRLGQGSPAGRRDGARDDGRPADARDRCRHEPPTAARPPRTGRPAPPAADPAPAAGGPVPAGRARPAHRGPRARRLRQPHPARPDHRGRPARPGRRVGHRTRLRHLPGARPARRGHRGVRRPRPGRPGRRRCSMRCGWAPTRCCAPGSRRTRRCPPPSTWSGPGRRRAPAGTSTPSSAGSPRPTWPPGSTGSRPGSRPDRPSVAGHRAPAVDHRGAAPTRSARPARRTPNCPLPWPPTTCRPSVHLVARPGRIDRDELVGDVRRHRRAVLAVRGLPAARRSRRDPGGRRRSGRGAGRGFAAGRRSRWPRPPVDGQDSRWLDLAAGPGGKAGLLGAIAAGRGATVDAVEVSPHRADLVRRTVAGLPVTVHIADGRDPGLARRVVRPGAAGRARAPAWARCGGDRRPGGGGSPADVAGLVRLQRELLESAARLVRPGGLVGYVTCSPHLAETAGVIGRRPAALDLVDARPYLPGVPGPGRRADRAAVAAPAGHRRDVPGAAAPPGLTGPRPAPHPATPTSDARGPADRTQHPVRRLRPARRGGRAGRTAPTGCTSM